MFEKWIPYYSPETKEQSRQWVFVGEKLPLKSKAVPSMGEVMITVSWDCEGIIFIDYQPKRETMNGSRYIGSLDSLSNPTPA